MCKPSEAQEGIVYRDGAHAASTTVTVVDIIDSSGEVVDSVLVGQNERFVRTADGFEMVQFDNNAPRGECPWKRTGQRILPPLDLKEAGRFDPIQMS
ncbi:MAG: hypothetical protein WDZ74_00425 [Candidatus Paceibacterota bacterium]